MQEFLISLSTQHAYLVYLVIIILACAEGPFISMVFGVLLRLGYFDFLPVYLALMFGDLIGDVAWYYIGFHFGHRFIRRFGKYFGITEEGITRATEIFHRHKDPILFVSKITNGFGLALATLMTAGMTRIPFGRYLSINLLGQFIWTGFLLSIGYFFGNWYIGVNSVLERVSVVVIFALVLYLLFRYQKYLQSKIN